jgi:hypothetical protein
MRKRVNYYEDLSADYSRPESVAPDLAKKLIADAQKYIALKEKTLPAIGPDYTPKQIEAENKAWWPTHCEALRQGRGDLLTAEYRDDLVYFCQDGPYHGIKEQLPREQHWWALIAQRDYRKRDGLLGPARPPRCVLLQERATNLLSRCFCARGTRRLDDQGGRRLMRLPAGVPPACVAPRTREHQGIERGTASGQQHI